MTSPKRNDSEDEISKKEDSYNLTSDDAIRLIDTNLKSGDWVLVGGNLGVCMDDGWMSIFGAACPDNYMGAFPVKNGTLPFIMLKKTAELQKILKISHDTLKKLIALEFRTKNDYRMACYDEKIPKERMIEIILSSFIDNLE